MKTNKKAILGMLVAMVMSLGVMGGMNAKNHDANLQQVGLGAAYVAGTTEGGTSAVALAVSVYCIGTSSNLTSAGLTATAATGGAASANPFGVGYWIGTAGIFL